MHALLRRQTEQIAALCRRHGVRRLEVFGSALREDFDDAESDVDLMVEFDDARAGPGLEPHFDLKADLEALLGRRVDLIELRAMDNTRLRRLIERAKVPVYATPA